MKTADAIHSWLVRETRKTTVARLLGGLACIVLGAVVLFVTFWMVYAVLWFTLWFVRPSHEARLWISAGVLVVLFIGNATTNRSYLNELSFSTGVTSKKPVSLYIPGVGIGSTINPLSPDSAHSIVKMITATLFTGPRLIVEGSRLCGRALGLSGMDFRCGAEILRLLHKRGERVPLADIWESSADRAGLEGTIRRLTLLDGVMLFRSEPPGLSLVTECREEIAAFVRKVKARKRET